jgi:HK97 family phage major capsid protein
MFVEKTQEELAKLNSQELQAYFIEKYNAEKSELKERLAELEKNQANEELSQRVKELEKKNIATLEKAIEEQGRVIKGLRDGRISGAQAQGIEGAIKQAFELHKEDFSKTKSGRHEFKMVLKAAGDMTIGGNVSGGTFPQAQRLEGINNIAERTPKTYDLIPKLVTDKNTIEWVYETAQDGTIDGTAEGAAKDQIDNDFVVTSVALVKRAAYMKVSTEMLDDASFMEGWLRNKLLVRLFLDVDNQCLNGNNVAPNLNGILNQSTAFAAGTFATSIDNANLVDVLAVAINQIKIANQSVENLAIILHPSDVTALKVTKLSATDKRYIDRLVMVGSTLMLDGVPIIENTNLTVDNFLVGDFSKATIVQKSGIEIEIGLDGNDFTKNMRTILAEWRGQLFIQNNDTTAFVKGVISTSKTALETP